MSNPTKKVGMSIGRSERKKMGKTYRNEKHVGDGRKSSNSEDRRKKKARLRENRKERDRWKQVEREPENAYL